MQTLFFFLIQNIRHPRITCFFRSCTASKPVTKSTGKTERFATQTDRLQALHMYTYIYIYIDVYKSIYIYVCIYIYMCKAGKHVHMQIANDISFVPRQVEPWQSPFGSTHGANLSAPCTIKSSTSKKEEETPQGSCVARTSELDSFCHLASQHQMRGIEEILAPLPVPPGPET